MKIKQVIALGVFAVAAGSVLAAEPTSNSTDSSAPLTRAEVKQSVLAARAAGDLIPAGEGFDYPAPVQSHSSVSRSELRHEVLQARADGSLRHAGEPTPE